MKYRPIVMTGAEVRAILDGSMTGTDKCHYSQVGDRLWVKETWGYDSLFIDVIYKATSSKCGWDAGFLHKSPVAMPRKHSRITLEITGKKNKQIKFKVVE